MGQFYLRDRDITRRIAAATPADIPLLEIGCGDGALTDALLSEGRSVIGVEIDPGLASRLRHRFGANKQFQLVEGNAVKLDWSNLLADAEEIAVVGNLPYHLASRILFEVLDRVRTMSKPHIREMVVMVQREVAGRICAPSGGRDYGSLTLLVKYHGDAEYLFTVPADSFYPKPQVDGGVFRLTFAQPGRFPNVDYDAFRRVVRGSFTQRRKMLRNALRSVNDLPDGWQELGFDFRQRPEQLTFEDYLRLTRELGRLKTSAAVAAV